MKHSTSADAATIESIAMRLHQALQIAASSAYGLFIMQVQHATSWIQLALDDAHSIGDLATRERAQWLGSAVRDWCRALHESQFRREFRRKSVRKTRTKSPSLAL
ncbi:MAG TPA: hypothetical protein VJT85_00075 [Gemmatimonadaceae bacterium]|nr:hypothetical protein [Gemmatimonadaceae bacterium]